MAVAVYLYDPALFFTIIGLWCLFGLLVNRWMLKPLHEHGEEIWPLWFWSILGCWAWPVGIVCGMVIRMSPPEDLNK